MPRSARRSREAASRRRERPLHLESLEPRLPLATGLLGTLVSIVDDSNENLLAAMSADRAVSVNEGKAITASVKLTRRPDAPVRVSFSSSGPLEIGVGTDASATYVTANDSSPTPPLVFTRSNWNISQTLSIRSIEDGVADGDRTLPVRYSVATHYKATVTKAIWIESRDSGLVSPTIAASGSFRGSLEGPGSSGTVAATYGVNKGIATFRVTSSQLANVRDRVISVDYSVDSANKVVVQAIRGFSAAGVKLDLTYRVGANGPGLSGVLALTQPTLGKQATLRVTAAFVTPGMPRLDGYTPVTGSTATVGGMPAAIAIGADGTAWVANPALNSVQRLVRLAGLWTVADTVSVGKGAKAIAVAPDGSAWVANADDNTIQQIVKKDGTWTANAAIAVAANPAALVTAKDGTVWVASSIANVVQRIASVHGVPLVTGTFAVGKGPTSLAVATDRAIWVASASSGTVQRISLAGNAWTVGAPIAVVKSPSSISAAVDGSIWVASAATGSLQRVARARGVWQSQAAVPTAGAPTDIAAHPDGSVWVAAGDAIQRFVPTRTGWAPQSSVTVGGTIAAIRSAPDGTLLVADAQAAIVTAVSAVASAVRNLAVAPTGAGALTLTWNAPLTGQPTTYAVTTTTTTASGTSSQILFTSSPSMNYSGLSSANAYAFSVAAVDANGSGPAATALFASVEDVATQPLALSAVVGPGNGEVVLSWQPPADDGGSPVISYTVTVYQRNVEQTVTTTSTSSTFSGLATGDAPLLFRMRATTFAGNGLPASLAVAADGTRLSLPPSNPYMGLEGTSTMHANAASSNAIVFAGPGTTDLATPQKNFDLDATVPSVLMSENGALVCVGVGTSVKNAQTPIVMLISPQTLKLLAPAIPLIKPQSGNLAGGLYNYLDHENRLVLVNGEGWLQWYSNTYDRATDTGTLTLVKQVNIFQPMVVGLVPDYEGRIWFATQGSLSANEAPAVVGYYDPQTGTTQTYNLPAGEMVANSISSSPAGVAVATTTGLALFTAGQDGAIQPVWHAVYENSGVRKPGQLSPGTGSTPVFFGPTTGYEYLVITDNATAANTGNATPAENVNVYSVADGTRVAQTGFLTSSNSGTENAPIAFGNRVFVPSSYGYWYPPPSETGNSVPGNAPFAGGFQGMTLAADGTSLLTTWGPANTVPSSALPRLSLADNLIYTVLADSTTQVGPSTQTTVNYSYAAIDANTGAIVGTPLFLGSNTFSGSTPAYRDTASYTWNTLQMTGVISPSGVFYQGTAGGIVMVRRQPKQ